MNEMNSDTPVRPKSKWRIGLLNLAGIVLIVGAALLYWRDIKQNKEHVKAANIVRLCASTPLMAMGLMLDSTGPASNAYMFCSADIASNIVDHLLKAEPTPFPRGLVEGDEYQIFMMYTNRTSTLIRAVRLYNDPENLYVGIRQPVKFNADNKPTAWSYTPPALVVGLGTLFYNLAETNVPLLRAQAPKIEAAITNGLTNAVPKTATPTDPADPSINEWMNATNSPAAN